MPPEDFSRKYAEDDYACGMILFDGGSALQVESHWASHQTEEFSIELFGTEAGARLHPLTVFRTENGAPQDIAIAPPKGRGVWERIASHFIDCVRDGVPCQAPLRHGLIVQEMMEGLLRSAKKGAEETL